MSDCHITRTLHDETRGNAAINAAWREAKPLLAAGQKLALTIKPAKRSAAMNERLHASIGDVAKQIEWAGKKRDIETWKRLLVAAWLRARGEALEILPAIDGHGVDIVFCRTSKLSQRDASELCEYVYAWGTEHGVRFTAPEDAYA